MARNRSRQMLLVDPDKCTGCRMCEVACSLEQEGICSPDYARLRIIKEEDSGVDFPHVCQHCTDAPCEAACPTSALWVDADGIVQLDLPKCIGCGLCFVACPVGAIFWDPLGEKIRKCNLCGGDPACVKVCEPGSLILFDRAQSYRPMGNRLLKTYVKNTKGQSEVEQADIEGLKT